MKQYIEQTDSGKICNHPQVEKFWEWGGGSMTDPSNKVYHYTTVMFKDGTRCDFGPNELPIDTDIQCNNFLNTIPE